MLCVRLFRSERGEEQTRGAAADGPAVSRCFHEQFESCIVGQVVDDRRCLALFLWGQVFAIGVHTTNRVERAHPRRVPSVYCLTVRWYRERPSAPRLTRQSYSSPIGSGAFVCLPICLAWFQWADPHHPVALLLDECGM